MPHSAKIRFPGGVEFEAQSLPTSSAPAPLCAKSGYYFWGVLNGRMVVETDTGRTLVRTGQIAFVPAGRAFSLSGATPSRIVVWRLRRRAFALSESTDASAWQLLQLLSRSWSNPRLPLPPAAARDLLQSWLVLAQVPARTAWVRAVAAKACAWQSLSRMAVALPSLAAAVAALDSPPPWQRALACLRQAAAPPPNASGWAAQASLSRSTLHRLCRTQTGLPPHEFLVRHRWQTAQALLLRTDRTILDIALAAGFGSASRLYAACRSHCGTSPSAWRRLALQEGVGDGSLLSAPRRRPGGHQGAAGTSESARATRARPAR